MRALVLASVLLASGLAVTPAAAQTAEAAAEPAIVAEARVFMADYARHLLAGDRTAIGALYSRDGAAMAGEGRAMLVPQAAIARRYVEDWEAPAAFEWRDLVFVPSGADVVTVIGRFQWTPPTGDPLLMTYHGLLVREDGGLRIRVEDEAAVPAE